MRILAVLFALALVLPGRAVGCTIPVYRYALERWELASYDVVIFERGPLDAALAAEVRRCQRAGRGNFEIHTVNLKGPVSPKFLALWKQQGSGAALPWLVVRLQEPGKPAAWTGPCIPGQLSAVLDSPARQRLVTSLIQGDTAAFVLLAGSDEKENAAAERMVRSELAELEQKIKLPQQSADGPQMQLALPLRVQFSLLPLRRAQAEEAPFVRMLLSSEEGLDKVKGPILFAFFGRGRLLGSLYGKQLNPGEVFEVAQFLCKECSCQVKEMNPGMDVLLHTDWPALLDGIRIQTAVAPLPVKAVQPIAPAPSKVDTTPSPVVMPPIITVYKEVQANLPDRGPASLWVVIGAGGGLLVVALCWAMVRYAFSKKNWR